MNMRARQVNRLLLLFGVAFLVLLAACRNEKGDVTGALPPGLIPADSMVKILVDVHLIESSLKTKHTKKPDNERFTNLYYDELFARHHITRQQFTQSLEYYQRQTEMFEKMYEQVITELSKLESQVK